MCRWSRFHRGETWILNCINKMIQHPNSRRSWTRRLFPSLVVHHNRMYVSLFKCCDSFGGSKYTIKRFHFKEQKKNIQRSILIWLCLAIVPRLLHSSRLPGALIQISHPAFHNSFEIPTRKVYGAQRKAFSIWLKLWFYSFRYQIESWARPNRLTMLFIYKTPNHHLTS